MPTKNQKVILTYSEALGVVQEKLNGLEHNQLKIFCEKNDLTYNTISRVKNNKLDKEMPLLIIKIMKAFGFKNEIITEVIFSIDASKENEKDPLMKDLKRASSIRYKKG